MKYNDHEYMRGYSDKEQLEDIDDLLNEIGEEDTSWEERSERNHYKGNK
jgi:hypothetical protein